MQGRNGWSSTNKFDRKQVTQSQNQIKEECMKFKTPIYVLIAAAQVFLSAAWTVAQNDAARAIYESSAVISTNLAGIQTFPAPAADFNPIGASDEMLAMYGFPPRPDKQSDAHGFALWERAMMRAKKRWSGQLKPHPEAISRPAVLSKAQSMQAPGAGPLTVPSTNWSGVANTNELTKWNAKNSFASVFSQFTVPVVEQAFGVCDSHTYWEVTWNGIDGANNGDVLQGGSSSQAFCKNGVASQTYFAWVEWYPSYPIMEVFSVNPGDDMYVETFDTAGGCNPGNVFVEDETTLEFGTFQLQWKSGPCLVGSSAEIVVERPFGDNNKFYPLANYIWNFALSWDFTAKGVKNDPGAVTPHTWLFQMNDDNDTQVVSSSAVEGKDSIYFFDEGCAYTGGCVF
jgi:hypothetical protein